MLKEAEVGTPVAELIRKVGVSGIPQSIQAWAKDPKHQIAKRKGRELWYSHFMNRICKVEREYGRPDHGK